MSWLGVSNRSISPVSTLATGIAAILEGADAVAGFQFLDTTADPITVQAQVGAPYSFQCTTNSGSPYTPYVWTDPDGVLAAIGLSISTGGLITGTPTTSGTIAPSLICTDAQGNVAQ